MTNDLSFLQQYSEVVNENVSVIIKQNFIFQTQLKIAESQLAILDDAKRTVDALSIENKELKTKLEELSQLSSTYKNITDDNSRFQVAMNETSQERNQLKAQLNDSLQELSRLRLQVKDMNNIKRELSSLKSKYNIKTETETETKTKKLKDTESEIGTF